MNAINFDNDQHVLDVTNRDGNYLLIPEGYMPDGKEYRVQFQGKWNANGAMQWCQTVRTEKLRQETPVSTEAPVESVNEREESETDQENGEVVAHGDVDSGDDTDARDRTRRQTAAGRGREAFEKQYEQSVEAFINVRLSAYETRAADLHCEIVTLQEQYDETTKEISKLVKLKEAL